MKKIFFTILILFCLCPHALCEDLSHIEGEDFFNRTTDLILSGNFFKDPTEILKSLSDSLFSELLTSRREMIGLLVIALLSGALKALESGEENASAEAASFACFVLITMSALKIFTDAVGYGVSVIYDIGDFVTKLAPTLMIMLASCGAVSSSAAFHPILSGAVYVFTWLIDNCILPLVYLSAVLSVVGHITPKLSLSSLAKLARSFGKWLLTAALTVFVGISAIYGFSAPALDAVTLKAAKFAVGSFVPVVGGILSDTVETVISSAALMKNAVGSAGIVTILSLCALPVIKLLAILIMLSICAAASEAIADKRITEMLKDISSCVSLVLGMVVTALVLFIICIAIIMGATG